MSLDREQGLHKLESPTQWATTANLNESKNPLKTDQKTHLEDSLADRRPLVGLIGAVPFGQLAAGLHGAVVQGLEDLLVKKLGLFTIYKETRQQINYLKPFSS